jgi:hypothetical protein
MRGANQNSDAAVSSLAQATDATDGKKAARTGSAGFDLESLAGRITNP